MRQLKSTTLNKWLVAKTLVDSTIAQAIETEKAASDTTLSLSLSHTTRSQNFVQGKN